MSSHINSDAARHRALQRTYIALWAAVFTAALGAVVIIRQVLERSGSDERGIVLCFALFVLWSMFGHGYITRRSKEELDPRLAVARLIKLCSLPLLGLWVTLILVRLLPFPESQTAISGNTALPLLHLFALIILITALPGFLAGCQWAAIRTVLSLWGKNNPPLHHSPGFLLSLGVLTGAVASVIVLPLPVNPGVQAFIAGSVSLLTGMSAAFAFAPPDARHQNLMVIAVMPLLLGWLLFAGWALDNATVRARWDGAESFPRTETAIGTVTMPQWSLEQSAGFINGVPFGPPLSSARDQNWLQAWLATVQADDRILVMGDYAAVQPLVPSDSGCITETVPAHPALIDLAERDETFAAVFPALPGDAVIRPQLGGWLSAALRGQVGPYRAIIIALPPTRDPVWQRFLALSLHRHAARRLTPDGLTVILLPENRSAAFLVPAMARPYANVSYHPESGILAAATVLDDDTAGMLAEAGFVPFDPHDTTAPASIARLSLLALFVRLGGVALLFLLTWAFVQNSLSAAWRGMSRPILLGYAAGIGTLIIAMLWQALDGSLYRLAGTVAACAVVGGIVGFHLAGWFSGIHTKTPRPVYFPVLYWYVIVWNIALVGMASLPILPSAALAGPVGTLFLLHLLVLLTGSLTGSAVRGLVPVASDEEKPQPAIHFVLAAIFIGVIAGILAAGMTLGTAVLYM